MHPLAYYHPPLVHFAIVLCVVGVAFRLVSLTGKAQWTNPAALTLILLGAGATIFAATSGLRAHGPVERIPGAAEAVEDHEDWGIRTRNLFIGVAVIELLAFGFRGRKAATVLRVVSGLAGIAGLGALYEAGEHGGTLVYSYAGGVGTRSGDPDDVSRLLVASYYNGALAARAAGKKDEASRLIDQLVQQRPSDPSVQLLAIESRIKDKGDPAGALSDLRQLPPAEGRAKMQRAILASQAFQALGQRDSARATLQALMAEVPQTARMIKPMLDTLR
jgi:uncharacterized membrane protein